MSQVLSYTKEQSSWRSPTLELLNLALPNIGMTISRMLMGFIDFYMVSHLGTAAQAAITPCTMLLFVIACTGMGMSQGVQTFVSQADGRKEPHVAGGYVWQTLFLSLIACVISLPIAWFVPQWFSIAARFNQHEPDVMAMEIAFLKFSLWSIGPMTACAGLEAFYNGIRRPMIALTGTLASLVTITVVNYVLIFGKFGFPAMGIAGSGIATLAAWVVRLIILLIPFGWEAIDQRYHTRRSFGLSLVKLREILVVGSPIAFQWLVDIGAWVVFMQMMIPPFGAVQMAAATIAFQFMHLSFMPAVGVGVALTTQVGNAIGAGAPDEAMMRVRVARRLIVAYMGLMMFVFVFLGGPIAGLACFETNPQLRSAVISAAATVLIWVSIFQIPDALCIVYSFASRGAGDTRVPSLLFAVCCWGIFVPGGWFMARYVPSFGVNGPWMMCTTYITVLSVLLWRRFHSEKWRDIRIFSKEQTPAEALPIGG